MQDIACKNQCISLSCGFGLSIHKEKERYGQDRVF